MEFKKWLQDWWKTDNHKKYQKYFGEWYGNLLPHQLEGFFKQMTTKL
jgi:hypothetical protein